MMNQQDIIQKMIRESIGKEAAEPLSKDEMKQVKNLDLATIEISDESLKYIKELTQVETLFLDGTWITGPGLRHLKKLILLFKNFIECEMNT